MSKVISSLKAMQRMERLATNVYRYQSGAFKGETANTLRKAWENEGEHAATLAGVIRQKNGQPFALGFLFAFAGGTAGVFTRLIPKKTLFSIDKYIERKAVEDYTRFAAEVPFDKETLELLNRIISDEKRHIENWNDAIEKLKK